MAKKESLKDRLKKEAERIKAESEKRGGGFEKTEMFTPKSGDNLIRVLPNQKDEDLDFYKRISIHYLPFTKKDGTEVQFPVRCLADFDEDCPMCEENERLFKKGDRDGAKKLRAQERFLYLILDYASKKVMPWSVGSTIHNAIVEFAMDLENPLNHDWKVVKKFDPKKGKVFGTSYSVRPNLKESSVPSKLVDLIAEAPDLDSLYETNEREKMTEYIGGEAAPSPKKKAEEKPAAKSKSKVEDDEMEDRMSGFEDEDDGDDIPEDKYAKSKKAASVKDDVEDEEDDLGGFDSEDDDLSEELRRLGVD